MVLGKGAFYYNNEGIHTEKAPNNSPNCGQSGP